MNRMTAAVLALCYVLGGCAEGGLRGSGISTVAKGNVGSVQTAALLSPPRSSAGSWLVPLREQLAVEAVARAATPVEGIRVAVEGTRVASETDADGRFSLRGKFEGKVTLVFERPEDGLMARLPINVPAGGTLTLTNIHIDATLGVAAAETQSAQFEGIITDVNCGESTIAMRSVYESPTDADSYLVRLDTSVLTDSRGNVLACADLRGGEQAIVHAEVNADGTFGNGTVEVVD